MPNQDVAEAIEEIRARVERMGSGSDYGQVPATVCKECDDIRSEANDEATVIAHPCATVAALDGPTESTPDGAA